MNGPLLKSISGVVVVVVVSVAPFLFLSLELGNGKRRRLGIFLTTTTKFPMTSRRDFERKISFSGISMKKVILVTKYDQKNLSTTKSTSATIDNAREESILYYPTVIIAIHYYIITMSEETYLEAFIEGLSTLPNDVKRNMELIRDLDKTAATQAAKMRKLQQEYIYAAEQKMAGIEVVREGTVVLGLREAEHLEPMFPSTDELMDFINANEDDASRYKLIKALQDECLQKADEKVAVAKQAMELIDAKVQRLDHDLSAMETLLQVGRFCIADCPLAMNVCACLLACVSHLDAPSSHFLVSHTGHGRVPINRWHDGQTQRHGGLSSNARFGMDLGQGIASRCR